MNNFFLGRFPVMIEGKNWSGQFRSAEPVKTMSSTSWPLFTAAVLLVTGPAPAQNLFVSDIGSGSAGSGDIYEFRSGGTRSVFAFGLRINGPGMAFRRGPSPRFWDCWPLAPPPWQPGPAGAEPQSGAHPPGTP